MKINFNYINIFMIIQASFMPRILDLSIIIIFLLTYLFFKMRVKALGHIYSILIFTLVLLSMYHQLELMEEIESNWYLYYNIYWLAYTFIIYQFLGSNYEEIVKKYPDIFIISVHILCFTILISLVPMFSVYFWDVDGRYLGLSNNPNYLATHAVLLMIVYLSIRLRLMQKGEFWRLIDYYVVSIAVIIVIICASRTVLISVCVLLLSFILSQGFGKLKSFHWIFIIFISLLLTSILFILYFHGYLEFSERFSQILDFQASNRWRIWSDTISFMRDVFAKDASRMMIGHGVGSILAVQSQIPVWPHNSYITYIFDYGIIGTLAIIAFFLYIIKMDFQVFGRFFALPIMLLMVGSDIGYSPVFWFVILYFYHSCRRRI